MNLAPRLETMVPGYDPIVTAVFIQCNARQRLAAVVARHAILARSSVPVDVRLLLLEDFPALTARNGQRYLREGRRVAWHNDDLQSFTPLRFLPPQLLAYEGRGLVIDPDVFAVGDIDPLLSMDMGGHAMLVRRIERGAKRQAYWASSVMLLDCGQLRHWRWEEAVDEMFDFQRDYRAWMSLELEDPATIGELDERWNSFDRLEPDTRLLHNTGRITQPWKTGLPLDFSYDGPSVWTQLRSSPRTAIGQWRRRPRRYAPHPDPRQEQLFFSLLRECVESGEITEAEIREGIHRRTIRDDALELLN